MGSWDYRVILRNGIYAVHDVFYNKHGEIWGWSEDPVNPEGSTLELLLQDLRFFLEALDQPVVREEDLPEGEPDAEDMETARRAREAFRAYSELEALEKEARLGGNWDPCGQGAQYLH